MRQVRPISMFSWVLALALLAAQASAEMYPSYECAREKMRAAASRCERVLKVWGTWARTGRDPQRGIDNADAALDRRWADQADDWMACGRRARGRAGWWGGLGGLLMLAAVLSGIGWRATSGRV